MCRLIESIKIKEEKLFNISYHNTRMNAARRALFGCKEEVDIRQVINESGKHGLTKCRIVYNQEIQEIQYLPYQFPVIRSLKVVVDDSIKYDYKFGDRDRLSSLFEKKEEADDILIVKNGLVTDSYFCNVVFEKSGLFFTPASCLLNGIKRQYLLEDGRIAERVIKVEDITRFDRLYLINAMIDLEDNISITTENILR